MVTKATLKKEIDQLDDSYLELVYTMLREFQRSASIDQASDTKHDPVQHSRAIDYAVNEDLRDVRPFAEVADAGVYVNELRRQWRGMGHG